MSRYEHGRVLAVNEVKFGSNLVSAHSAGVTSLTVEDAADFDEAGGTLTINGQVIDYTTFDDDTGTITLSAPLAAAGDDGDRVDVYDPLYGAATSEKVAQIELDGDDGNTDPLEATIALHLQDDLDEGLRGTTGESVLLEQDGDEWRLVDVLGRSNTSGVKFYDLDTFTAPNDGAQAFTLTHLPIDGSVHMAWGDLWQPHTEYTRTGKVVSVPDPTGLVLTGDVFDFRYAYRDAATNPTATTNPLMPPSPVLQWNFDETSGTIAADATANGRTGTISGSVTLNQAPVFSGQNKSYSFSGGSVSAAPYNPLLGEWTLIVDINPTNTSSFHCIASIGTLRFYLLGGKLNVQRNIAGNVTASTTLAVGSASRVGIVVSNDTTTGLPSLATMYVNGAVDGAGNTTGGSWTWAQDGPLIIGSEGSFPFAGRIDAVRMFGRALTATEMTADWNGGSL